jgi:hypothetical protein
VITSVQDKEGLPMPLFTGPDAGAAMSHLAAVAHVQRAHDSSAVVPPSSSLIDLIRAGKLTEIGFAVPRSRLAVSAEMDNAVGAFALTESGQLSHISKLATAPPVVASAQQFCLALFATILPALIDRPAAMMEWITLGRTALTLEAQHDWSVARSYVSRVIATSGCASSSHARKRKAKTRRM